MVYTLSYYLFKIGIEERVFCDKNNCYYVPLNITEEGEIALKIRNNPGIERRSLLSCLADIYIEELDPKSILKEIPKSA